VIGLRLAPERGGAHHDAWVPTDDPEDAALPLDRFVYGETPAACVDALIARHPAPEGTIRVRSDLGTAGVVRVWKGPALPDADVDPLRSGPLAGRAEAWARVAAVVHAVGRVYAPDYRYRLEDEARAAEPPVEVLECHGSDRACLLIPARPAEVARREATRKGVATRAARRKAREEAADAAKAKAAPLRRWLVQLRKRAEGEIEAYLASRGAEDACYVRGWFAATPAILAAYDAVLRKDHRRLPEYREARKAAAGLSAADVRAAEFKLGLDDGEDAEKAWIEAHLLPPKRREGARPKSRNRGEEASVA